jgi:hypothetical protein
LFLRHLFFSSSEAGQLLEKLLGGGDKGETTFAPSPSTLGLFLLRRPSTIADGNVDAR